MISWLKKARRTGTPVRDTRSEKAETTSGMALAYRLLAAMQGLLQLVLWLLWQGYDASYQTAWQAALLLALPLGGLWALWAAGGRRRAAPSRQAAPLAAAGGGQARGEAAVLLLLLPCLMLDMYFLQSASFALMKDVIPSFSDGGRIAMVALLAFLATLGGKENGVAYGAHAFRLLAAALYLFSTLLLFADGGPDRLWPLLGAGPGPTALTALGGVGAVWGVALLFALPQSRGRGAAGGRLLTPLFVLLPLALCLGWALWMGMVRPWRPTDGLTLGRKLLMLSRFSKSILICEAGALFWMVLLPLCICGTAMTGDKLLRAALPKLPQWLCVLLLLAPGTALLALGPGKLAPIALTLSPYRTALSALTALLWLLVRKKEGLA